MPATALSSPDSARLSPHWLDSPGAWSALPQLSAAEPWASPLWLRLWWECFAPLAPLRFLCLGAAPHSAALLPLYADRFHGLRRFVGMGGDSQRRPFPIDSSASVPGPELIAALLAALRARRDWDILQLNVLPLALAQALAAAASDSGLHPSIGEITCQRFLPLDRPWPDIAASWRPSVICHLARTERALRKLGPLNLLTITDGDEAAARFELCLKIEASGWKGRQGTAMLCVPPVARFYRLLVPYLARLRQLRLMLLYSGDTLLAFRFCVQHHGALAAVKSGYNEAWRKHSPGQILLLLILRQAHQAGLTEYDFLGGDDAFKQDWTPHFRPLAGLRLLNTTPRGRLASASLALRRWHTKPCAPSPPLEPVPSS